MDRTISTASQLGAIVRGRRRELNVSQADAGALISVTQGRYSQLEKQIDDLTIGRVLVLLRHLGLEMVVREVGDASMKATAQAKTEASASMKVTKVVVKNPWSLGIGDAIKASPQLGSIYRSGDNEGSVKVRPKNAAPPPGAKRVAPTAVKKNKGGW